MFIKKLIMNGKQI